MFISVEFDEDLTGVVIEEDQAELELHSALTKARKVKQKHERKNPDKVSIIVIILYRYLSILLFPQFVCVNIYQRPLERC